MIRKGYIKYFMMMAAVFMLLQSCKEEAPPSPPPVPPARPVAHAMPRPEVKEKAQPRVEKPSPVQVKPAPIMEAASGKDLRPPAPIQLPPGFEEDKKMLPSPRKAEEKGSETPPPEPVSEALARKESELAQAAAQTPEEKKMAGTEEYDPGGRVDPFSPLIREEKQAEKPKPQKIEAPKRILTPLEKMELSQIRLVAVIMMEGGALAMVEEANGKGYEVRLGTYMGRNGGIVTEIRQSSIVVKEIVTDFKGQQSERFQELKMQKNDNGE